jgi:DNA-binding NtrC family response regulator
MGYHHQEAIANAPIEVLLIDDDPDILSLLQDTLYLEQDFIITATTKSMEAIDLARSRDFELVITDLMMPVADGLTVACAIKEVNPEALIVIITGFPTLESAIEAIRLGVYDYLPKPFSHSEFSFTLHRAAKHIRMLRENRYLRHRVNELEGQP